MSSQISLDTTTGLGFVGKGAVQSSFGWNNAGLQTNAAGITFSYQVTGVYEQSCRHAAGQHMTVQKTFKKTVELSADVAFAARRNPQDKVTGFNLTGISAALGEEPPTDLCNPGQSDPESVWTPDPDGAYPIVTQTSGPTTASPQVRARLCGSAGSEAIQLRGWPPTPTPRRRFSANNELSAHLDSSVKKRASRR